MSDDILKGFGDEPTRTYPSVFDADGEEIGQVEKLRYDSETGTFIATVHIPKAAVVGFQTVPAGMGYTALREALQDAMEKEESGLKPNRLFCVVCGNPQFETKHGVTCTNGHGGAEGYE